jgi:Sugar kinases, ribokinase family
LLSNAVGVLVSFDSNYRAIRAKSDIVFAGDEEAAITVGPSEDPMELARRIAELGPRQVIIKRGCPYVLCQAIFGSRTS